MTCPSRPLAVLVRAEKQYQTENPTWQRWALVVIFVAAIVL